MGRKRKRKGLLGSLLKGLTKGLKRKGKRSPDPWSPMHVGSSKPRKGR